MEVSGKLLSIMPEQSGTSARGTWRRHDFVIETTDEYPKKVYISNMAKVEIASVQVGTMLRCHVNLESRESNGRWYTDVRIWKMEQI